MATNEQMAAVESAGKEGKLESVNIEIAENGFLVSCHYKPKKSKKNEPMPYEPPKKKVFESVESLKAFLDDALPNGKSSDDDEHE